MPRAPLHTDRDAAAEEPSVVLEQTTIRDPLIGAMLGEYQVQGVLGAGGMGQVYRGLQPIIGKPVAIKVLKPEVAADPSLVSGLIAEARAVNAIRHPGIVDIFSFGATPDGRQYVVMELVDGQPLDQYLVEHGKLSAPQVIDILTLLLSALGAAHAAGVIHRDLKPANLIVTPLPEGAFRVKILDFGLAKLSSTNGETTRQTVGIMRGTPHYMPPEQARAQPISGRTDLYAVGIIAFELLTGTVPFDAPSIIDVISMHCNQPAPRPSTIEPSVPEALDELVLQLLEKKPEQRPESADAVRRQLIAIRNALASAQTQVLPRPRPDPSGPTATTQLLPRPSPITARPVPAAQPPVAEVPARAPRSKGPLVAAGVVAAAALVALMGWGLSSREQSPERGSEARGLAALPAVPEVPVPLAPVPHVSVPHVPVPAPVAEPSSTPLPKLAPVVEVPVAVVEARAQPVPNKPQPLPVTCTFSPQFRDQARAQLKALRQGAPDPDSERFIALEDAVGAGLVKQDCQRTSRALKELERYTRASKN
jgi:serine/threonine protein kinase